MIEEYTLVIKDAALDVIFTQTIYIKNYDEYLRLVEHAKKLVEFFSFDCSYEMEEKK